MTHTHQFIEIDRVSKSDGNIVASIHRQIFGIKAGCILCGEIRNLWPDGTVEVVIKGTQNDTPDDNTKD